jgi:hypothetical protein
LVSGEEEKKLEQLNKSVKAWDRAERLRRLIAVRSSVWPAEIASRVEGLDRIGHWSRRVGWIRL